MEAGQAALPWLDEPWAQAMAQRGHALLLHGPARVGQFELAVMLAQSWLCERPDAHRRPCGRCEGCQLLKSGSHPDFRLLIPESLRATLGLETEAATESADGEGGGGTKSKTAGRDIKVADVRAAIDWTHRTASRGGLKVLVVHPAQRLNVISANALLKTLEEPPAAVRIVLSADDPQALLPTLRSRCQRLPLTVPPPEQARDWLKGQGIDGAEILLPAAGGRPQEVLAMVADGIVSRLWSEIPAWVRQGRSDGLQSLPIPRAIDVLQKVCSDALAVALGARPQYFPAQAIPPGAVADRLAQWWTRLTDAARHADHPWNAGLLIESLVLHGRACWAASTPSVGTRPRSKAA